MSIINSLEEIISTINEEINGLDDMLIDSGIGKINNSPSISPSSSSISSSSLPSSSSTNQENEFTQYYNNIKRIKESSIKSKIILSKVLENEEKTKYIINKLKDYGDLIKRIERLTSAIDELEYKVLTMLLLFPLIH